jgi:hypothetical protein
MKDSGQRQGEPPKWNWEDALKTAILLKLSVEQFEEMTPYELTLHAEAYIEKEEAATQEKLTLVWLGEYYHRTKRLPSLKDELKKISGDKNKNMTDTEMLQMVKELNAQFGGTVEKGGE